jgi:hypothetical protein
MRMQLMIEALAQADRQGRHADAVPLAYALEQANVSLAGQGGRMRAADHQFQQALVVGVMDRQGTPGVKFDVEGSGYGFRVVPPAQAEMPHARPVERSRTARTQRLRKMQKGSHFQKVLFGSPSWFFLRPLRNLCHASGCPLPSFPKSPTIPPCARPS